MAKHGILKIKAKISEDDIKKFKELFEDMRNYKPIPVTFSSVEWLKPIRKGANGKYLKSSKKRIPRKLKKAMKKEFHTWKSDLEGYSKKYFGGYDPAVPGGDITVTQIIN